VDSKDRKGQEAMPLSLAAEHGHDAVVKLLLEKGAKVNAEDKGNRTALCWAARFGHESTARLLLENGAELDSKDEDNRTALWWAPWPGNESTASMHLMGVYLMSVYLMGVYFMNMYHRMQPFLLSRTCVFAAFGGPDLMPHFSFWR
jgi:hypothetical protein